MDFRFGEKVPQGSLGNLFGEFWGSQRKSDSQRSFKIRIDQCSQRIYSSYIQRIIESALFRAENCFHHIPNFLINSLGRSSPQKPSKSILKIVFSVFFSRKSEFFQCSESKSCVLAENDGNRIAGVRFPESSPRFPESLKWAYRSKIFYHEKTSKNKTSVSYIGWDQGSPSIPKLKSYTISLFSKSWFLGIEKVLRAVDLYCSSEETQIFILLWFLSF